MKLIKKQKDNAEKKLVQEQYPKVKTFSRAYDYSPASGQASAVVAGRKSPFSLDERPYPVTAIPGSVPETTSDSQDLNDQERIDLQDTILTDESFVERPSKRRPQVKTPVMETVSAESKTAKETRESKLSESPEKTCEPEESEKADEVLEPVESVTSEELDKPEEFHTKLEDNYSESEDDLFEPFILPEPEVEFESDPFYNPEEEPELLPETNPEEESAPEADEKSGSFFEMDADTEEPSSWLSSGLDEEEVKNDKTSLEFKKKIYTVKLKKKTDLKKKLRLKPEGSLKWKSSDKKIAKVSRNGILKPKKKGKITVRVKTDDGEKAKVRIRIKKAKKLNTMSWESFGMGKKGFF